MELEIEGRKAKIKEDEKIRLADLIPNNKKNQIVAAKVDGKLVDLSYVPENSAKIEWITLNSPEGIEILRHSTSHVMAEAVQKLFPNTKVTIGPSIKDGFYYDFDVPEPFHPEDLEKIEAEMRKVIEKDVPFIRKEVPKQEAIKLFESKGEKYKVEILKDILDETVSLYEHNGWVDLCRGPHLPSTGFIKAFKLTQIAGAYWRGDERNPMLYRIYGTAFPTQKELDDYLKTVEEAKKRDHRKLGPQLELFMISEEVGPGFPIYLPKGGVLRYILEDFLRKLHYRRGYQFVYGPTLLKIDMWKRSGHYDHYRKNMYFTEIDEQQYGIKPMNCLAHMLIYKSKLRSYRDLPMRLFEMGTVHRHEKSGVLHGLLRVRAFTQDDAHIICRPDQLPDEIQGVLNFVDEVMKAFGFEYFIELSTRPPDSIGTDEQWEAATSALKGALEKKGLKYEIHEGEGAFYGPKIDIKLVDCLGRPWQCATIQADFAMPERFELEYIGQDGQPHRPAMIHRVVLGSMERFIGVLIEQFAGAFPVWLAPIQAKVLTITDDVIPYAEKVLAELKAEDFRVDSDFRNQKIGYKIREAQLEKIPYMIVIGRSEMETDTIRPRTRKGEDLGAIKLVEFIKKLKEESQYPIK